MRLSFCIIVFLFFASGFSQNSQIDELRKKLNATKKDSLKTSIMADLAWELLSWEQYDSVKYYAEKAEALAGLFKDVIEASNAQNTLGVYYRQNEDFDKALLYFQRSLENRQTAGSKKGIAMSHNNIGSVFMQMKEYEKALGYYSFSMNLYEEMIANENYREEITSIKKSLGNSYHNIAAIFYFRKEYQLALKYYRRSYELELTYGSERINQALTAANMGRVFAELNKTDSAIVWFNKSSIESEAVQDSNNVAESSWNTGIMYMLKEQFDKARACFEKSILMLKPGHANQLLCDSYFRLGWCYAGEKNYNTAIPWYEKSYKMYSDLKLTEKQKNCAKKLAEAYEAAGNKKEAKKYFALAQ